jgi:hypothetical protein
MTKKRHNKKLPKDGVSDKQFTPKYGNVRGEWGPDGSHDWWAYDPDDTKKTFRQSLKASGSYHTTEYDSKDKEIHTSLTVGEHRHYVAGGHSTHVDGHRDLNTESTDRRESGGDNAMVTAKDSYHGTGGKKTDIIKDGTTRAVGGGSEGELIDVCNGNKKTVIEKDSHSRIKKDYVKTVEGKAVRIHNDDYAVNNAKGFDVVTKEKTRIKSEKKFALIGKDEFAAVSDKAMKLRSKDTMTANSAKAMAFNSQDTYAVKSSKTMSLQTEQGATISTKQGMTLSCDQNIKLKVGGSEITITSSGITFKGSSINFEQG